MTKNAYKNRESPKNGANTWGYITINKKLHARQDALKKVASKSDSEPNLTQNR